MPATLVTVYVVSANRLLREALARMLNSKSNLRAVATHRLDPESIQCQSDTTTSVLLLDAASVVPDEIAALCASSHKPYPCKTIVLGIDENEEVFVNLVQKGVRGFLLRDASATDVVAAIRMVACGEVTCPARLSKFLFNYVIREHAESAKLKKGSGVHLSRREIQLVPLIARGLTNKEIAVTLGLAEQTVKNHVHNILRKTEVEDRQEVLDACHRHGTVISVEENGFKPSFGTN